MFLAFEPPYFFAPLGATCPALVQIHRAPTER